MVRRRVPTTGPARYRMIGRPPIRRRVDSFFFFETVNIFYPAEQRVVRTANRRKPEANETPTRPEQTPK